MTRLAQAVELMTSFAERTGITNSHSPQRYLWTDAFAVCNFLGLARATGDGRYREIALRLIDQVHHTLGRHRPDDGRAGWISGLDEQAGEAHPTRGGLRIGKKLPERRVDESLDAELEWDRDGQYFHYLTQWMHALDQASRATGQPLFNVWARELAAAACGAFSYRPRGSGRPRMYWKMSIDLSRPLVLSMGHHDPLDGYITCVGLRASARELDRAGPSLTEEEAVFASMTRDGQWATDDPLGIGGLLRDACRVAQLIARGAFETDDMLCTLLDAALTGLRSYARAADVRQPAWRRLAFRELGLAIGLHGVDLMLEASWRPESPHARALLDALLPFASLGSAIESFWLEPANRDHVAWSSHRDINEVMLATSLVPEGILC